MSRFADAADARDAVDARGLKLATDDLCDTAVEVRADLEDLAGIFCIFVSLNRVGSDFVVFTNFFARWYGLTLAM
jgi:hypothetical protein